MNTLKKLEASWNARTPKFLHNRTKENFVFQLVLGVGLIVLFNVADKRRERQERRIIEEMRSELND